MGEAESVKRRAQIGITVAGKATIFLILWFLFPTPFFRGLLVGALLVLVLLAGGVFFLGKRMRGRLGSRLRPPPLPTESWDYSMELSDLTGTPVDTAQFLGRVLVLNFWATWCAPCVAEIPSLRRLQDQTSDLDVRLALVTRESADVVRSFLDERGTGLPVYLLAGEPPECFRSRAIPATFVLDKSGMIAMRHFGAAKWDAPAVIAFLRGLAATPSP